MPEFYHYPGTDLEPEIDFSLRDDVLAIRGPSYMVNAEEFYEPHLDWLDNYLSSKTPDITFEFAMTRVASRSKFQIEFIVSALFQASTKRKVTVRWRNPRNSDAIATFGRRLKSIIDAELDKAEAEAATAEASQGGDTPKAGDQDDARGTEGQLKDNFVFQLVDAD